MEKKIFSEPRVELINLDKKDVIITSGGRDDNEPDW